MEQLVEDCIATSEMRHENYIQEINKVKDSGSLVTKTPWLRHTKWAERFVGKDMEDLNHLADAPNYIIPLADPLER
jgi:hypothetical protein